MRKKIIFLSTALAVLIILSGLSPTICSKDIEISNANQKIIVEVNRYNSGTPKSIFTEMTQKEAEEIKEILINLNAAIDNNDESAISYYESILNEKGLFGNEYQKFYSQEEIYNLMKNAQLTRLFNYLPTNNGDNISNSLCYFNAIGNGTMFFPLALNLIESITRIIENASSPLAGLILLLIFLPFIVLMVLFTSLIPFRILMSVGVIYMNQGKISSIGLGGVKNLDVIKGDPVSVNVSYFTGLTISIPFVDNPFVFVSGIAFDVRETGT